MNEGLGLQSSNLFFATAGGSSTFHPYPSLGVVLRADLLPALKGEGSLRADHGFAVYRLRPHHLTAGGFTHPAPFVQR
jgi:hypothetical protein